MRLLEESAETPRDLAKRPQTPERAEGVEAARAAAPGESARSVGAVEWAQPAMAIARPDPAIPRRGRRRRWGITAMIIVIVIALTGGALALGPQLKSPAQVVADAAPPAASVVTAAVERRKLSEPVVLRGKVKPGPSVALRPPTAAIGESSVVTSVEVRKGERLREGQVLLVRSGEPMMVFRMPFAPYRDLSPGSNGPDVEAIQQVLERLGYHTGTSGKFDARTQAAVKRLYQNRGYPVPETTTSADDSGQMTDPDGARERPSTPPSSRPSSASTLILPRSAIVPVRETGQLITKVQVKVGSVLADVSQPLLELDGGTPYLETLASADQVNLLRKGQRAAVTDDVAGRKSQARISAVGTSVVSGGQDGESGFRIRLEFTDEALEPAEDRTVRIDVEVAEGTGEVLAVPVTAVFSKPDGSTFVTVLEAGRRTDIAVTAGTMAGGWVEIEDATPDALKPGTQVVVSEDNLGGSGGGG